MSKNHVGSTLRILRPASSYFVFPPGEVHLYLWMFRRRNIVLSTNRFFFYLAKFTIPTPLSLLSSCKLSFPISSFKIPFLPNFALKSTNTVFKWHWGKWLNSYSDSSLKPPFELSLLSLIGDRAFRTIISYQRPRSTISDTVSLTNSLNFWYYSLMRSQSCP
jgi:hypothetical protein